MKIYEQKELLDPDNFEVLKGKMNCFRNTFDWENLSLLVERMWEDQVQKSNLESGVSGGSAAP